jgi:hypothetical protein
MAKIVFALTMTLATWLAVPVIALAQAAPQSASTPTTPAPAPPEPTVSKPAKASKSETLTIAGYPGQVPVVQLNDKSYVDLEQLARLTKGSLTFRADQILLTFSVTPVAPPEPPKPKTGFSKAFLQTSIEQLGVVREWRSGIEYAIQKSYPLGDEWVAAQRRNADKSLALASAAISTEDDRSALPLLAAELDFVQNLSDDYLAMRSDAQYISPDWLNNDTQDQQILACSRGIAAMFSENKFQDVADCH